MKGARPFVFEMRSGFTLISLLGELDYHAATDFENQINQLVLGSHVMIDCEGLITIPRDWLRTMLRLQLALKKRQKSLRLLTVGKPLMSFLKAEGVDTTFRFSVDLREAKVALGLARKVKLDAEFINPFLSAAIHVLKVQAQVEAKAGRIQMKNSADSNSVAVSGVIGIVSDSFQGLVVFSFPEETFLKIVSSMVGETCSELSKDILDGAGELTSMIFGHAKVVLNERGFGIQAAIPSVVCGKNNGLTAMSKGPVIVVPFESQLGNFYAEICLDCPVPVVTAPDAGIAF